MLPEISHVEKSGDLHFWITTDGVVGTGFAISGIDLETQDILNALHRLRQCLKQIDPRILVRIRLEKNKSSSLSKDFPRSKALSHLGYNENKLFIYFDYVGGFEILKEIILRIRKKNQGSQRQINVIFGAISVFAQQGFKLSPLSETQIKSLFKRNYTHWRTSLKAIETGTEKIGLLRLEKMPFQAFELNDLVKTIEVLPVPFSLNVSFQRLDEASGKMFLERKLKQSSSGKDVSSQLQENATSDLIKGNLQTGSQLFNIETLVEIKRRDEEKLSLALDEAGAKLSLFSDTFLETFGIVPTYCATLPGNKQHVTFLESEEGLSGLLPIFQSGEAEAFIGESTRSLTLLREDQSLYHFDLFNPSFNVFNTLIVGTSGKGKSVLTGLLTQSLLNDPNVCIIKLDVGGSHSKECELFGGTEFQLSLDKGSGINPFEVLLIPNASDNDKIGILSKFLASLIQEQGEAVLTKTLRSEVESSVREYIDSNPSNPCLDDFYNFCPTFPRRELLKRWVKGGLYEAAFAAVAGRVESLRDVTEPTLSSPSLDGSSPFPSELSSPSPMAPRPFASGSRLRYYNFSQIFQAADPEFAQAGIAAVLAQFNMEMLRTSGMRLVLICDETPFFIKSCFDFFKFSTANVRKYGHAVVLISQLSTDFIVDGDTGIIENSPQRFLFSIDGDETAFQERFNLGKEHINQIKNLRSIVGTHSETLLQTGDVARKLKVKVTQEEYWTLTTSRTDKEKLIRLMEAVPGLTLREAINCLSMER